MTDPYEGVTEFVGYGDAADYLGLKRNTLSSYCARGIGPQERTGPDGQPERRHVGQYLLPVFERAELDRWRDERPGQGHRSDLIAAAV